ncbi:hypothetical protein BOTBODRAFT_350684 [Botryobasidium botryosum FD-172 SS1]|uniref:Uncharacterized protein n=1 Tax=Botryobasidium botryosum (strain FD-172 SS1) TaxID=930990 RepID=A0A067MF68_BOTB1|nr:hypothetical protein BOTBODRAFT_350684 [Botryobasidium botryosum FD-172 SS1]
MSLGRQRFTRPTQFIDSLTSKRFNIYYRCDRNCNKFCFRPIARPAGKFSTY